MSLCGLWCGWGSSCCCHLTYWGLIIAPPQPLLSSSWSQGQREVFVCQVKVLGQTDSLQWLSEGRQTVRIAEGGFQEQHSESLSVLAARKETEIGYTWGVQGLRSPNFFLGSGSRKKRESSCRRRGCSLGWARPSGNTVLPVECLWRGRIAVVFLILKWRRLRGAFKV